MKSKVCGYLVLRKPEHSYDDTGRLIGHPRREPVGNRFYGGVDRMPWADLDEAHYAGALPSSLAALRAELYDWNGAHQALLISPDLAKTRMILAYVNARTPRNEICGVYSERLSAKKGSFDAPVEIAWLGVDVVAPGRGSILDQGFFLKPNIFRSFDGDVNGDGLFDADSLRIQSYVEEYVRLTPANNLEPVDDVLSRIDKIAVGRIR